MLRKKSANEFKAVTRCNFFSNLQRNSTLLKFANYIFPSQFTNISYQIFVTNLYLFHHLTTFVYMTQNMKMHDLYRHIVVVITHVLLLVSAELYLCNRKALFTCLLCLFDDIVVSLEFLNSLL